MNVLVYAIIGIATGLLVCLSTLNERNINLFILFIFSILMWPAIWIIYFVYFITRR